MEAIPMAPNLQVARRQVEVRNVLGLHMRVAHEFVSLTNMFQSEVKVYCKGVMADGRSILRVCSGRSVQAAPR
jgi:phosphotransferase system HPr (HPr) family protein